MPVTLNPRHTSSFRVALNECIRPVKVQWGVITTRRLPKRVTNHFPLELVEIVLWHLYDVDLGVLKRFRLVCRGWRNCVDSVLSERMLKMRRLRTQFASLYGPDRKAHIYCALSLPSKNCILYGTNFGLQMSDFPDPLQSVPRTQIEKGIIRNVSTKVSIFPVAEDPPEGTIVKMQCAKDGNLIFIEAGNTIYLLFFGQLSRDAVAGQDVYRRIVGYLGVFYWEVHTLGMDTIFCHDLGENDLFFNPWYLVKTFRGDLDVSGAAPIQNVEDLWQHEEFVSDARGPSHVLNRSLLLHSYKAFRAGWGVRPQCMQVHPGTASYRSGTEGRLILHSELVRWSQRFYPHHIVRNAAGEGKHLFCCRKKVFLVDENKSKRVGRPVNWQLRFRWDMEVVSQAGHLFVFYDRWMEIWKPTASCNTIPLVHSSEKRHLLLSHQTSGNVFVKDTQGELWMFET